MKVAKGGESFAEAAQDEVSLLQCVCTFPCCTPEIVDSFGSCTVGIAAVFTALQYQSTSPNKSQPDESQAGSRENTSNSM